jgi:hypothetical protein
MPYWMTSPDHGVMPVYDLGAVEQAKKHGWSLLNHGESPEREMRPEEVRAKADEVGMSGPVTKAKAWGMLDAAGIKYDKRWGIERLLELLPKVK